MRYIKHLQVGALCLALGAAACADLSVTNPNQPDASRAIKSAGDVESLISGAYNTWFNGVYSYNGPGMFLSNQSFQHTAPWANSGMEFYGRLPRQNVVNDAADQFYINFTTPWYQCYSAISGVANGLSAMAKPNVATSIGNNINRDKAFGYFVLGMAHASIALLYDKGFVVDETTDLTQTQTAKDYKAVMTAALAFYDKALALTNGASFTIPKGWMPTDADVPAADFAKIIHSMKARYMVEVARTPTDRAAVNWPGVISEVNAGITSSFIENMDANNGWYYEANDYATSPGWSEATMFVWGMADQSGNYQFWLNTPLANRQAIIGGRNILIVTPDQRFPQGSTVADQTANKGKYLVIPTDADYGTTPAGVWARPDRGTWRWSYYYYIRRNAYNQFSDFHMEEIPISEMNMLKAEGLFRQGDKAGAAALVNISRVGIGGLSATDANGTNTSCVPKLPDGTCGNLWEMIKWEKRVEGAFQGLVIAPWFFDGRGWGDLYKGTPLQFPAPCKELQVLQLLPCYTFGGSTYPSAAPVSSYNYPGESS